VFSGSQVLDGKLGMMPRRMYTYTEYTRTSVAYTRADPGAGGPWRGRLQHCSSHHPGKRVAMPTSERAATYPAPRRGHMHGMDRLAHRSSLPATPSVLDGPLGRSNAAQRHGDPWTVDTGQTLVPAAGARAGAGWRGGRVTN
jgi:hypothetical protein